MELKCRKNRNRPTKQNSGKRAFAQYVDGLVVESDELLSRLLCCNNLYDDKRELHKHVSQYHKDDINDLKQELLREFEETQGEPRRKRLQLVGKSESPDLDLPTAFCNSDTFVWLPHECTTFDEHVKGQILLFYHYRWIENTTHVMKWQNELCTRLRLTGKIRIAHEGLNATVGGTIEETEMYMKAVLAHPIFNNMASSDFKRSEGCAADFPDGLKINVYQEICPMGVNPLAVPFTKAGKHISPQQFHEAIQEKEDKEKVFVDCRNFYESKIGAFEGAMCPDIRKFSYWPEYVDKNEKLFKDKTVYMYCTGGIRCERGSAYLMEKGICKDVLQLSGGIHKYMDQFPNGHFKGKLFVFDDRYHSHTNNEIISNCTYCKAPWDNYQPCTSKHCYQLVLSCPKCRAQSLTTCCRSCAINANSMSTSENDSLEANTEKSDHGKVREECDCTKGRSRIPVESTEV